jgi:hypothetical protein
MQTLAQLPVVLEYPWWTWAGLLAVGAIGVLLVVRLARGAGELKIAAAVPLIAISLWSGGYYATWTAAIDAEGVSVAAPFDFITTHGHIGWRDVISIAIGGRRSFYTMSIVSRDGTLAQLSLSDLPREQVARLTRAVVDRAPGAELQPTPQGFLTLARRATRTVRAFNALRVHHSPRRLAGLTQTSAP